MDVSVVIPVYNGQAYVKKAIESVLAQREVDFEIICVNDASTDKTQEILEEISQEYPCLKAIYLAENQGQANARNVGVGHATGRYIYFLDADDSLCRDEALSILVRTADERAVDGLLFESEVSYENEELCRMYNGIEKIGEGLTEDVLDGEEFFYRFISAKNPSVTVWRQFWRKEYLLKNQITFCKETSPHEDLLFTFQAIFPAKKMSYLSKVLHRYWFRSGSASSGTFSAQRYHTYEKMYVKSLEYISSYKNEIVKTHTMAAVRKYIDYLTYPMYERYTWPIKNGEDIWRYKPEWLSAGEKMLCNMKLMERFPLLERVLYPKEYEILNAADHLILYGAGAYAKDMERMLSDFGIANYDVAVTKKDSEEVFAISELTGYQDCAVVILAVTDQYRDDMRRNALDLGYKNIFEIK